MIRFAAAALLGATVMLPSPVTAAITFASDPILFWNERATTLYAPASAPVQARAYAMMNIAMHDAVNATLGRPNQSYLGGVGASGGDAIAAASQAAYDVMRVLNPAKAGDYLTALTDSLGRVADGAAKDQGRATGAAYAAAVLAARGADGATNPLGITYASTGLPGDGRPTTPGNAALPVWGDVTPFVLDSGDQVRPGPPPARDSEEYAAAYNEVKAIGSKINSVRTQDQTDSALFWDNADASPWMKIGLLVAEDEGLSTLALASAFGRLSTGLADALIAGFDAKYEYRLWRPLSAIRDGEIDGNPDTAGDPAWASLFDAPLHPSYISTHSALSGAGSTILTDIFGDDEGFELTIAESKRKFSGLQQAAKDGADSRLWGGIHFRFDNDAGLAMGQQVGRLSLRQDAFQAVPEPATWAMMIAGFGLIGGTLRRGRRITTVTGGTLT